MCTRAIDVQGAVTKLLVLSGIIYFIIKTEHRAASKQIDTPSHKMKKGTVAVSMPWHQLTHKWSFNKADLPY